MCRDHPRSALACTWSGGRFWGLAHHLASLPGRCSCCCLRMVAQRWSGEATSMRKGMRYGEMMWDAYVAYVSTIHWNCHVNCHASLGIIGYRTSQETKWYCTKFVHLCIVCNKDPVPWCHLSRSSEDTQLDEFVSKKHVQYIQLEIVFQRQSVGFGREFELIFMDGVRGVVDHVDRCVTDLWFARWGPWVYFSKTVFLIDSFPPTQGKGIPYLSKSVHPKRYDSTLSDIHWNLTHDLSKSVDLIRYRNLEECGQFTWQICKGEASIPPIPHRAFKMNMKVTETGWNLPLVLGCFPYFYIFGGLAIVMFVVTRAFSMIMHWRREHKARKKAEKKAKIRENMGKWCA